METKGNIETYKTVSPEEFNKEIKSSDVYLLDVRTPEEFESGHLAGAHNIDVTAPDFIEVSLKELPKPKTIAVYCGSGKRSAIASKQLSDNGYNVLNMDGGLMAWKASGLPTVK